MNNTNLPQEVSVQESNGPKKWLKILVVILAVIIITVIVLAMVVKKSEPSKPFKPLENQNYEKPIKYGEMILKSEKESVTMDETFKVEILMNTKNANIVVGSAKIIYDVEIVELINVDYQNSVLSMTAIDKKEPGKIEIVRGIPGDSDYLDNDDGYNGTDGNLATLEFKALKSGATEIKFNQDNSNMILDDGNGTEMVVEYRDVIINIQ